MSVMISFLVFTVSYLCLFSVSYLKYIFLSVHMRRLWTVFFYSCFLVYFLFLISSHNVNSTCIYKIHNAYIYCVYYFLSLFFPPFFSFPFFPSFSVYLLLNVCLFVIILILWIFSLYLSPYFFILCLSFPPFFFLSFFFSL